MWNYYSFCVIIHVESEKFDGLDTIFFWKRMTGQGGDDKDWLQIPKILPAVKIACIMSTILTMRSTVAARAAWMRMI